MAKVTSLITLKGTIGNMTFVKSPTYGDHIRAKRGTHKKAEMNAACKRQSKKLVKGNTPAKIIKDAIDPYRQDFREGKMWQRLVSAVQKQGDPAAFDFSKMKPFEIYDRYRLRRFFDLETKTRVDKARSVLRVAIRLNGCPHFTQTPFVDGYRIGVIAIFPDVKDAKARTAAVYSEIMPVTEASPPPMEVPFPPKAKTFLICVRVEGFEKGEADVTVPSKGMRIVEGGRIVKRES
jgi:hypothetical protein